MISSGVELRWAWLETPHCALCHCVDPIILFKFECPNNKLDPWDGGIHLLHLAFPLVSRQQKWTHQDRQQMNRHSSPRSTSPLGLSFVILLFCCSAVCSSMLTWHVVVLAIADQTSLKVRAIRWGIHWSSHRQHHQQVATLSTMLRRVALLWVRTVLPSCRDHNRNANPSMRCIMVFQSNRGCVDCTPNTDTNNIVSKPESPSRSSWNLQNYSRKR